jgi:hypothetical protein
MIDIGAQGSSCPHFSTIRNVEISSFDDDGGIQGFQAIATVSEKDPPGAPPGTDLQYPEWLAVERSPQLSVEFQACSPSPHSSTITSSE